jgi:hypothetical protein
VTGLAVPAVADETGRSLGYVRAGLGRARFNPINDDRTDDETAFGLFEFDFGGGAEFRRAGRLLAPWFDIGMGELFGKRKHTDSTGRETGDEFKVFSVRITGLFGLGFQIVDYVLVGPHVGYRMELYSIKFGPSDTATSETGIHHGLQYGAHVRLRTRSTFKKPATLFGEARYEWRRGEYQTARYLALQAGVHLGVYFVGWYETRLGSSGEFLPSDVSDVGEASAASIPIDQLLGGGIMIPFY